MANKPFSFFPLPWSGPVTQDLLDHWFSPAVTYNFAGDATIEKQVVESVASYGRQIGWLNEVVLALAGGKTPSTATVERMRQAAEQVEALKAIHASSAFADATDALARLKKESPRSYDQLLLTLIERRGGESDPAAASPEARDLSVTRT
ncbi:hypothetical protein HAV22_03485 [Massilia sp. TW-1]|uniref:Uncharacterized protein n=1 Tax=Telluria antibiotica TaxID=2717319 RepID=A0ABX0P663_9BURK|nr:hypothetical protein [Telluria antibiotica]NIA52717.1 hypothetical protein [Telluria antibiotica]